MALHRDTSRHFDQRLRLVANVVDLDPGIELLRSQLNEFQHNPGRPVLDRLADAVLAGNTADCDVMFACALAEAASTPALHNAVITAVRERIHRRICDRYAATAVDTYKQVAALWNTAAKRLTDAHLTVDIEANAELVLDLPDKQRKQWREAITYAADLERLTESLLAAAVLAGLCDDSTDAAIDLCIDPGEVDRATITDCWTIRERERLSASAAANRQGFTGIELLTPSRTGRFGVLLRAGATLRAATLEQFQHEPQPAT